MGSDISRSGISLRKTRAILHLKEVAKLLRQSADMLEHAVDNLGFELDSIESQIAGLRQETASRGSTAACPQSESPTSWYRPARWCSSLNRSSGNGPTMSTESRECEEIIVGRMATRRESFYCDYGYELHKSSLGKAEAHLQRTVAIVTTLLGGSLIFLKDDTLPPSFRAATMLLLLASLAAGLHGQSRQQRAFNADVPESVESAVSSIEVFRSYYLSVASALLWAGLAAAVCGSVPRLLGIW